MTDTKVIRIKYTSPENGARKQTMQRKTVVTKRTIKTYIHKVLLDASLAQF